MDTGSPLAMLLHATREDRKFRVALKRMDSVRLNFAPKPARAQTRFRDQVCPPLPYEPVLQEIEGRHRSSRLDHPLSLQSSHINRLCTFAAFHSITYAYLRVETFLADVAVTFVVAPAHRGYSSEHAPKSFAPEPRTCSVIDCFAAF